MLTNPEKKIKQEDDGTKRIKASMRISSSHSKSNSEDEE